MGAPENYDEFIEHVVNGDFWNKIPDSFIALTAGWTASERRWVDTDLIHRELAAHDEAVTDDSVAWRFASIRQRLEEWWG